MWTVQIKEESQSSTQESPQGGKRLYIRCIHWWILYLQKRLQSLTYSKILKKHESFLTTSMKLTFHYYPNQKEVLPKEDFTPISLMNTETKNPQKVLINWIQLNIKKVTYYNKMGSSQVCKNEFMQINKHNTPHR